MSKCILCQQEKKLIKAHVIPEFFYKDLYNQDGRFYNLSTKDIKTKRNIKPLVQTGAFDKEILCEKCDNEKLSLFEKYGKKILYGGVIRDNKQVKCSNYKENDFEYSFFENVDYKKFKLFLLSILLRSHHSKHKMFKFVDLGPHANKIRDMIWNEIPGEDSDYSITIAIYSGIITKSNDVILPPLKYRTKGGFIFYLFSLGVYQIKIFVNSSNHKLPDYIKALSLKCNNTIIITKINNETEFNFFKKTLF